MGDLELDTRVTGGDGRYHAEPSDGWRIWGPMGGYVASIALRAAAAEVVGDLLPASFSCQFFAPAEFRSVDIEVRVRRATRRTAALAVSMTQRDRTQRDRTQRDRTQQDRPVLDAQVWFATESPLVDHDHATHHGLDGPDDYHPRSHFTDEPEPFPFWSNFDTRVVSWIDDWETYEGGDPWWAEWLRFVPRSNFEDPVLDACRLLVLADLPSFPAATRAQPGSAQLRWVAPSLDLAVQFHRLESLGEWLLTVGIAPIADRGLIGFRSEVWTADHRMVASGSGQLLTRPMTE